MRKFFLVITALIVAVVVGAVIFRRLSEDQYDGCANTADVRSDQATVLTVHSDLGE